MTSEPLWSRGGHLLELAMFRALSDEMLPDERVEVDGHLGTCLACRRRWDELVVLAGAPLPAMRLASPPMPPRRQAWILAAVATVAAIAAALLVGVAADPPSDRFAPRGGAVRLEVWRADPGGAGRLLTGDAVRAGERLGFRVWASIPGHLQIAGLDATGKAYLAWPPPPSSGSSAYTPGASPLPLDAAIQLDATLGAERLLAVLCEHPLAFSDLAADLGAVQARPGSDLPPLRDGCSQAEVRLEKVAP